jgi:hypothetical protein
MFVARLAALLALGLAATAGAAPGSLPQTMATGHVLGKIVLRIH